MENKAFTVRCYSKSELAGMYFPTLKRAIAVRKLRRWIIGCTPLMEELEQGYYSPLMRTYTAREVKIIVHHLGEPFD